MCCLLQGQGAAHPSYYVHKDAKLPVVNAHIPQHTSANVKYSKIHLAEAPTTVCYALIWYIGYYNIMYQWSFIKAELTLVLTICLGEGIPPDFCDISHITLAPEIILRI